MTTDTDTELVYGEQRHDLLMAFMAFGDSMILRPGGMAEFAVSRETVNDPLLRAVMRAEADLIRESADLVGASNVRLRNDDERFADALMLVLQALGVRGHAYLRY